MDNNEKGFLGEQISTSYLIKNHYQIIAKNYRKKWGEIDIVAFDRKTKETVFVEVKSRLKKLKEDSSPSILPEEELTEDKIKKLQRAILSFLNQYHLDDKPWRFDLLAIEINDFNQEPEIRHYKDIYLEF
ncbi:MAG: YraN family protein [Minisyncoccia bacterium]